MEIERPDAAPPKESILTQFQEERRLAAHAPPKEVGDLLIGNTYHMTPTSKAKEMTRWDELKAGPRGKGGHGYPDDLIIPICDEINNLPHVCTLQSCAGHETQENEGVYPGNLWLWFTRPAFNRFLVRADEAALAPGIEQIRILYRRYNDARFVVEIVFDGYNEGAEAFDRSIKTIMRLVKEVMPEGQDIREGAEDDDVRIYPCADCGTMRSKAEGGTTFTVCDECWDKHWGKKAAAHDEGEQQPVKIHTDRVQTVLTLANAEANDMGHTFTGTQHLLLGLLREGEGIGCVVLAQLGFDAERLYDAVREQARRLAPPTRRQEKR